MQAGLSHVIEMNHQAGQRLGCNVYLVYDERNGC